MTQEQILEGNKLIAEFMGYIPIYSTGLKPWTIPPFGYFNDDALAFNSDWRWLMPVVEKIEALKYHVHIEGNSCLIESEPFLIEVKNDVTTKNYKKYSSYIDEHSKIKSVWQAVIQFIQWYTSLTPKSKEDGSV